MKLSTDIWLLSGTEEGADAVRQRASQGSPRAGNIPHSLLYVEPLRREFREAKERVDRLLALVESGKSAPRPEALLADIHALNENLFYLNELFPRRVVFGHLTSVRNSKGRVPVMDVDGLSLSKDEKRLLLLEWKRPGEKEWQASVLHKAARNISGVSAWLVRAGYYGSNPAARKPVVESVTDMVSGRPVCLPGTDTPVSDFKGLDKAFAHWWKGTA